MIFKHILVVVSLLLTVGAFHAGCPFNEDSDSPKANRKVRSAQKETFAYHVSHVTPFWGYQYASNPHTGRVYPIHGFSSPHQISYPLWSRATPAFVLSPFHYYPFQFKGLPHKQTKPKNDESIERKNTLSDVQRRNAEDEGLSRQNFNVQTPNDCTCNSTCRCSPDDGCMVDWCPVEGSCGESRESRGNWDWCLFKDEAKPNYVDLDWKTKQDLLWSQVKLNDTYGDGFEFRKMTRSQSLVSSFRNDWDVIMPPNRHKTIHSVGASCPFTMDISKESPFTGIFKPGAKVTGLMRMSPSTDFTNDKNPGLRPSVGIKFLRSGTRSANFVAMKDLNALANNSHNFFEPTLSNALPPEIISPITLRLVRRFCTTRQCINKVGLSNVCTFDQDGKEYKDPIFPFRVFLEPNKDLYDLFPQEPMDSIRSFLDNFKKISVGTKVYSMRAQRDPNDEGFILGDIVTTDECVSSWFGDKTLFFRHQWFVEDIALRPQWAKEMYDGCHCHYPEIEETDPIKAKEEMDKFIEHQLQITYQFDDPSSNDEPLDLV